MRLLGSLHLSPTELLLRAHAALPDAALPAILSAALGDTRVALCLHRVRMRGPHPAPPSDLTIDEDALDRLIEALLASRPRTVPPWLTVTFDDGYEDSAAYAASRARRFATVEWILFVCPAKLRDRVGFRWDLDGAEGPALSRLEPGKDVRTENARAELRALADRPELALVEVERARALRDGAGIELGNHTNLHFNAMEIPFEDARHEYATSHADFEALFGPTAHFAFPFGTPGEAFGDEHVAVVRELGYRNVWSTEPRPYDARERTDGAVLPRFPIRGTWPLAKTALFIASFAARWRARAVAERARTRSRR